MVDLKDEEGNPLFKRTWTSSYSELPLAVNLYRKILSEAPDGSVTIASVGFSTNLARLLESPADEYSPLSGKELVAKKVALLSTMAGNLSTDHSPEYNVMKDIPAAKEVFSQWPGTVVTSPFEVGIRILYPGKSIQEDFGWAEPSHPVVEAYKVYRPMPFDQPTWDLTSVVYAVEGLQNGDVSYFGISSPGTIEVTDSAGMIFREDPAGNRFYLTADSTQVTNVAGRFLEIIPKPVGCCK